MQPTLTVILSVLGNMLYNPSGEQAAYLDPGSGSFILQLVIASAVGLLFVLRGYWSRFLGIFRSDGEDTEDETESSEEQE